MALTPGTRLGPYVVSAPIGSGGMGEVYKATDTRLDRTVAIKVLPEHVAADPELRQRFEREAKTLAALSHPHICSVYDVGRQDPSTPSALRPPQGGPEPGRGTTGAGQASAGQAVDFLVMEYLDGETLAQRLAKGALALDQALQVAIQIADALDKAHRKGIVHRDLKTGNIMLIKSGVGSAGSPQAKLLDFGLAKLVGPPQGGHDVRGVGARDGRRVRQPNLSDAPTVSAPFGALQGEPLTGAGSILGTLQYMAPEQLEGQEADARTDIFAFGAVVYEMVTGKKAFEGASQASLMAAILEREPPPMSSLQPVSPPTLDRVVKKCLAKSADERWQSAKDLHDELRWIADAGSQIEKQAPSAAPRSREQLAWSVAAAGVLAAVGLAVPALRHVRESPSREMRTELVTPATDNRSSFALSPDGTQIVYAASGDDGASLWLRPLNSTTAEPLPGTDGASRPFWSADGRSVAFFANSQLKRLDLGGAQPQVLAAAARGTYGGAWNADGVILFAPGAASPLFRIRATGGEAVPVTKLQQQNSHRSPWFLPGGRQFVFFAQGTPDTQGIYLGSLDSDQTTRLTASDSAGAYLSLGWLVWRQGSTLRAQRLDLERRELVGDLLTLADPVEVFSGNERSFSVSDTGLLAYRTGADAGGRQLAWFDRTGKAIGVLGEPNENLMTGPRVSPDGRRVVVHRTVEGNADLWLLDVARTSRVTFDAALDRFSVWSPDGSRIVFDSNRTGERNLYIKPAGGAGAEELLVESAQNKTATDWSRDGRFLLFNSFDPQSGWDLWVSPMSGATTSPSGRSQEGDTGDRTPWVFLKTNVDEQWARLSPDGRWVAYMSNESGRSEIYVRPFVEGGGPSGGQWQISEAGGVFPTWRSDGKELYYLAPDGGMMAAPIEVRAGEVEPGAPVVLFPTRIAGGGVDGNQGRQYDVARDGRFLINVVSDDAATVPITLLQNWRPAGTP